MYDQAARAGSPKIDRSEGFRGAGVGLSICETDPAGNFLLGIPRASPAFELRSSCALAAAFSDFLYLPQMVQVVSREHADDVG